MHDMTGTHRSNQEPHDQIMIWTRSIGDLESDRQILMALPVSVIHVPCISIEFLPIDNAAISALTEGYATTKTSIIFTSQNAVGACAQAMTVNEEMRDLLHSASRIVTHGRKTAAAAEKIFQRPVDCIDSMTSAALVNAIKSLHTKNIWFSGEDVAIDLKAELALQHSDCTRIVVYKTKSMVTDDRGNCMSRERLGELSRNIASRCRNARVAICFASPSAINGWMAMVNTHPELDLASLIAKISVAAIGPTTAKAAVQSGFQHVSTCAWPAVADLAALGSQLASI